MAAGGGEEAKAGTAGCGGGDDLYAVLGLKKECSAADLRSAYKKLALRWHPDRCCAAGSSKATEDAKTKFQAIQEAYSVLSDTNKRFLYDVGVYDSEDGGDANGMGEFLGELAAMMSQSKSHGGNESFEQLQELFVEMFQADVGGGGTATASSRAQWGANGCDRSSTSNTCFVTTSYSFCYGNDGGSHKRDCDEMQTGSTQAEAACDGASGLGPGSSFCFGAHEQGAARGRAGAGGKRRNGRMPKTSSRHGHSSQDGGTLA